MIGAAIGNCGRTLGAETGPDYLKQYYPELTIIRCDSTQQHLAALPSLTDFSKRLAAQVSKAKKFMVIGGDHSCAIGTWSGVAMAVQKPFGLIWVDAHLDAHTPQTSHSKNFHGMSVAVLLGQGDNALTAISGHAPVLQPEHLIIIGARSYEPEEHDLLKRLGVKIYDMQEVQQHGFKNILLKAQQDLMKHVDAYGLSIDVDAFDPKECSATGTLEPNGVHVQAALDAFSALDKSHLLGVEIAEFNPLLGDAERTAGVITEIIAKFIW